MGAVVRLSASLVQQAAAGDDRADLGWEGRNGVALVLRQVLNGACRKVHFHFVAVRGVLCRFGAFEYGEPDIDAVAEEDTREVAGDDAGYAARLYRDGRVMSPGFTFLTNSLSISSMQ